MEQQQQQPFTQQAIPQQPVALEGSTAALVLGIL
jgi:hypothetical protein